MTINNIDTYIENLWDWGILNGCFGDTKIAVTDIDGFVERRGKFLLIETKSIGKEIPNGQKYTFESLMKTGLFTILIVWGTRNTPQRMELYTVNATLTYENTNLEKMREIVRKWFVFASKK